MENSSDTHRGRLVAILLLMMAVSSACASPSARPTPSPTVSPTTSPSASATANPSPPIACADRVLAAMTSDQLIGQLFELGLAGDRLGPTEINLIQADHIGSVWFVATTTAGVAGIAAVTSAVQGQVSSASTANVRFFIAANQEGGVIQAMQGPGFSRIPSAVVQGQSTPAILQSQAATWGQELHSAGINFNFAPVMDVVPPGTDAQNQPIGALQREYGHDPATAGSHGVGFLTGMHQSGIAVSLKHFPGLGRVAGNTDFTTATDTTTTASDPYLQSFKDGIAANADFVMVALARYTQIDPNHLAAFSSVVITQMLRNSLGFGGVIISDDLGATAAVANIPPATRAIDFLSAGGDMIISKTSAPADAMVQAIRARVATDPAFSQRVDDAALRILKAKQAYGLLPC
ncbi:MAG TPA: glycoside hydrolase family 3 N-terminal domain-containing protein [Candidatus Acidoferrum sp.]|nr:glycoside hydrolase family 3 N-terminal domain-containing protein [Candidatus Acidoferrum sp.]